MRNVLYLFVTMPVGGAEILCLNIMKNLDRGKYNPMACCIADKGYIGEKVEKAGLRIIELGRMRTKRIDFKVLGMLSDLFKKEKIDIVHTNMYHAGLYGRLAVLLAGKPRPKVVASHHSLFTRRKVTRLLINRLLNAYTDRIIAVSQPVKDDIIRYERASADKVRVLENSIDINRFNISMSKAEARERLGLGKEHFVLGMVGRLVPEKGHRYLFEAMSILKKKHSGLRLVIAGSGRIEGELKEEASRLGLSSVINFLGMRDDIPEIYRAMDLFVMASTSEAVGLVLLEAMAAGLPCLVTSVGGMVGVSAGGKFAATVPPRDPQAMADAIDGFIRSKEKLAEFSRLARLRVVDYGFNGYIRELEAIYDGI